jgi:hypothetical protein
VKIEFLESGSYDCPLIRIYGAEPEVCHRLREAFEQLADGGAREFSLTDLPGVEPLGGCRLVAQASNRDHGIIRQRENVFYCVLTGVTWDNVAGLMEPFCDKGGGYQWLCDIPASDARVLISTDRDGCW